MLVLGSVSISTGNLSIIVEHHTGFFLQNKITAPFSSGGAGISSSGTGCKTPVTSAESPFFSESPREKKTAKEKRSPCLKVGNLPSSDCGFQFVWVFTFWKTKKRQSGCIRKATCLFEVNTHWYIRLQQVTKRGSRVCVIGWNSRFEGLFWSPYIESNGGLKIG